MTNLRDRICLYSSWLDDERHRRTVLIGLLVVAFALRLAAALILPIDYRYRAQDAVEYVSDARHLLTLGVFGEEPGVAYAQIPPAYPLFIAAIFALTKQSLMAVRLVQVVLSTLIVWLTYLIGREITSKNIVLLGVFVSAVYPVWLIYTVVFMTETLYTVLLLVFTWCLIRSLKVYTAKFAVLTGVTFGLALLTREILFVFPLLLPVAFWWSRISWQHAWRYLLLFAIATLLVLSPWLARNYHTFGQVFYTERTEAARYQLTGSGYLSPRYEHLAGEKPPPTHRKPPEYYERFGSPSDMIRISNLFTAPKTYLRHLANRLSELWLHPNGLLSLPDNLIIRAIYVAAHLCLVGLAVGGIVVGLRRRDVAVGTLSLLLMYFTGTCLFFTGSHPRYTLPFLPLLFVLMVVGLESLLKSRGRGDTMDARTAREV